VDARERHDGVNRRVGGRLGFHGGSVGWREHGRSRNGRRWIRQYYRFGLCRRFVSRLVIRQWFVHRGRVNSRAIVHDWRRIGRQRVGRGPTNGE